ncbi:MAG: hypothetical protein C4K58_03665 [Flavobacteriaceae bacterium]|nr:MAG: hypothetical protein C4K58_03665 [Flavobacteriaceae bacterium]
MKLKLKDSKSQLEFRLEIIKGKRYDAIQWIGFNMSPKFFIKCYLFTYFSHLFFGTKRYLDDARKLYNLRTKEQWILSSMIPRVNKLDIEKWAIVIADDPITNNTYNTVVKYCDSHTPFKVRIFQDINKAIVWLEED